jgi:hypothetical protein
MHIIKDELHHFWRKFEKVRSEPLTTFDHVREWRGPADYVHKFRSGTHKIAGPSSYPCCGSVTFWCGSVKFWYGSGCGSGRSKKHTIHTENTCTYISFFTKSKSQNSRNQGFLIIFVWWWKDPNPYMWLTDSDADLGGLKTYGSNGISKADLAKCMTST